MSKSSSSRFGAERQATRTGPAGAGAFSLGGMHFQQPDMSVFANPFLSERPVETYRQTSEVFGDFGSLWVRDVWPLD